jgi:cytochrome b561
MTGAEPARGAGRRDQYDAVAIALHWSSAAAIACTFPLGLYLADLPAGPDEAALVGYHQWLGVTVLALTGARIGWRLGHRAPDLPDAVPVWQRRAARAVHWALDALAAAIALSGLAYSAAAGLPPVGIGGLVLPGLVAPDEALAAALRLAHRSLGFALLALVVAHVAAALKHQFVDRDGLLLRMLPGGRYFFGSSGSGGSERR